MDSLVSNFSPTPLCAPLSPLASKFNNVLHRREKNNPSQLMHATSPHGHVPRLAKPRQCAAAIACQPHEKKNNSRMTRKLAFRVREMHEMHAHTCMSFFFNRILTVFPSSPVSHTYLRTPYRNHLVTHPHTYTHD